MQFLWMVLHSEILDTNWKQQKINHQIRGRLRKGSSLWISGTIYYQAEYLEIA